MKKFVFAFVASYASLVPALSQNNDCDTLESCQDLIKTNPRSSLAHYRVGEIYFQMHQWVPAVNTFRHALNGDLEPRWIEVWVHINLGKIYDATLQRERALNEYRLARRTKDNTRGAQDEVDKYTDSPYTPASN